MTIADLVSPHTCQTSDRCGSPPCFQGKLWATADSRAIHKCAASCAIHLGDMVLGLTAWAQDHDIPSAELEVLVVDPAVPLHTPAESANGYAFATILIV